MPSPAKKRKRNGDSSQPTRSIKSFFKEQTTEQTLHSACSLRARASSERVCSVTSGIIELVCSVVCSTPTEDTKGALQVNTVPSTLDSPVPPSVAPVIPKKLARKSFIGESLLGDIGDNRIGLFGGLLFEERLDTKRSSAGQYSSIYIRLARSTVGSAGDTKEEHSLT
jgi:hypothetical protein